MRRLRPKRGLGRRVGGVDVQSAVLDALRIGRREPNNRVVQHWRSVVGGLLPLGGVSTGNRLTLYRDGDSNFLSMWQAIERATTRVWLQTYTLEPDAVGLQTIACLEQAASRGLDVRLLFDSVGSWKVEERHVQRLQRLGATVVFYNPVNFWKWSFAFLHRNHRKLCVVDSGVAFVGGMNVSADYAGPLTGGNSFFADVNLMVEGPAVLDLMDVFEDSLSEAATGSFGMRALSRWAGALLFGGRHKPTAAAEEAAARATLARAEAAAGGPSSGARPGAVFLRSDGEEEMLLSDDEAAQAAAGRAKRVAQMRSSLVQVLESNVRREKLHIQRSLPTIILSSRSRCYITSPYFLPPRRIRDALIGAARRGVDVRIVTAGRTDVRLATMAARHLYSMFMSFGIHVYEMQEQALHAKLCVIDDVYTTVGSFNLDVMSNARNLEVSVHVLDPHLSTAARDQVLQFIGMSRRVCETDLSKRTRWEKVLHWLAYMVCRLPQVYRPSHVGDDMMA